MRRRIRTFPLVRAQARTAADRHAIWRRPYRAPPLSYDVRVLGGACGGAAVDGPTARTCMIRVHEGRCIFPPERLASMRQSLALHGLAAYARGSRHAIRCGAGGSGHPRYGPPCISPPPTAVCVAGPRCRPRGLPESRSHRGGRGGGGDPGGHWRSPGPLGDFGSNTGSQGIPRELLEPSASPWELREPLGSP